MVEDFRRVLGDDMTEDDFQYHRATMDAGAGSMLASAMPGFVEVGLASEDAVMREDTKYSLGSVLNHVLLHQTVIGQEAMAQLEQAGAFPDVIVGCVGGGSNFAGLSYPLIRRRLRESQPVFGCTITSNSLEIATRAASASMALWSLIGCTPYAGRMTGPAERSSEHSPGPPSTGWAR